MDNMCGVVVWWGKKEKKKRREKTGERGGEFGGGGKRRTGRQVRGWLALEDGGEPFVVAGVGLRLPWAVDVLG